MATRVRGGGAKGVLPRGEREEFYVAAFLAEFGVAPGGRGEFVDVMGERLVISDDMFRDKRGRFKVKKLGHERFVLLAADTVKRPDAIYETWAPGQKARSLHRNYVSRWAGADGNAFDMLVVFGGAEEWRGVTAFSPEGDYVTKRAKRNKQEIKRVYDGGGKPAHGSASP